MKNILEKIPHPTKMTVIGPEVMMSARITCTGVLVKNPWDQGSQQEPHIT